MKKGGFVNRKAPAVKITKTGILSINIQKKRENPNAYATNRRITTKNAKENSLNGMAALLTIHGQNR